MRRGSRCACTGQRGGHHAWTRQRGDHRVGHRVEGRSSLGSLVEERPSRGSPDDCREWHVVGRRTGGEAVAWMSWVGKIRASVAVKLDVVNYGPLDM